MYERQVMDVTDALRAVDAVLAAADGDDSGPVAVAVVDDNGDLAAYARMDGAPAFHRKHAVRKAFTASRMGSDLADFATYRTARALSAGDFGEELVAAAHGGVVVRDAAGDVVGAIGVQSSDRERDERLARLGLAALERGEA